MHILYIFKDIGISPNSVYAFIRTMSFIGDTTGRSGAGFGSSRGIVHNFD